MKQIIHSDAVKWAREYNGDLFHALLCDPPYHLTSIVKRFGSNNSAPAKPTKSGDKKFARLSKGFMGKQWDGGDVAFHPETWYEFSKVLHPGAFGMAFASSRGWHRLAVAIEDAGFIIHPSIFGWAYGSGFPKATRVKGNGFEGHRYGLQALKPALEPIIVFQKPYEGRPIENITEYGSGTLNIDAGRIGTNGGGTHCDNRDEFGNCLGHNNAGRSTSGETIHAKIESIKINRFIDGAKPFGNGAGHEYETTENIQGRWPANFILMDKGAAKALDRQSGYLVSGQPAGVKQADNNIYGQYGKGLPITGFGDEGGASRFFFNVQDQIDNADPVMYEAKAGSEERDAGLRELQTITKKGLNASPRKYDGQVHGEINLKNSHPTVKPIALTRYLASLLLPPTQYAPRKLFVPFAGVASEVIGAMQAGWDEITGVEMTEEYIPIANARIEYWRNRGWQTELFKESL